MCSLTRGKRASTQGAKAVPIFSDTWLSNTNAPSFFWRLSVFMDTLCSPMPLISGILMFMPKFLSVTGMSALSILKSRERLASVTIVLSRVGMYTANSVPRKPAQLTRVSLMAMS